MTHLTIRQATPEDAPLILDMITEMHSSTVYSKMEFNVDKVKHCIGEFINSPSYFTELAFDDRWLVGLMVSAIQAHWCSDTLGACDVLLYVTKPYRASGLSIELISRYKQWALDSGIDACQIEMGISTHYPSDKLEKTYNDLGFKRSGTVYRLADN